jgi:hypothetical protein
MTAEPRVEWAADAAAIGQAITDGWLLQLYAYWLGLDCMPAMPSPRGIDAQDMIQHWPGLVLVEVVPPARLRYCLVGPKVTARIGLNPTGRFIDEVVTGARLAVLNALYGLVHVARAPVYSQTSIGQPGTDLDFVVHRLMLPLSHDGKQVSMVIAGQAFRAAAGIDTDAFALADLVEWDCRAWVDAGQAAAARRA